ncbi:MAG TPA: thiol:disulfide interchange protein DsbA/DsbL [Gammaproteobacteria bacterium]|nr:thiol:disulfide interchange protein DsbA/DsbL [Gammaproteobacteria bacterium]
MKPFHLIVLSLLMSITLPALADQTNFFQGIQYEAVKPAQQTDVKPGQIEVIEFYWYGCPVCNALEPYVEGWEKQLPANVVFKRVPAAWPNTEFYVDAQAIAVADVLGIGEKIREPFFNAIHEDGEVALRTDKDALRQFFAKFGIKPADFDAAWDSAAVKARLIAYQKLADAYDISGVPTLIVNGKWKTGAGHMMPPSQVMDCVNFLIAKEQTSNK